MKYIVIEGTHRPSLEKDVEVLQEQGWACQGGVSIAMLPPGRTWPPIYTVHYAQAMIKEESENAQPNS